MQKIIIRHAVLISVTAAGLWLTGCAEEKMARFGVVGNNLSVGDYAPDFSFVGENGNVNTFDRVREVVTIVVFPDNPAWPVCARCKEIVEIADKMRTGHTPVGVVSIATPSKTEKECAAALHRCAVKGQSQLIALHDHKSRIRTLYGPQATGKFFIIDRTGRVSAIGPLTDRAAMEKALREAVEEHEQHWKDVTSPPTNY